MHDHKQCLHPQLASVEKRGGVGGSERLALKIGGWWDCWQVGGGLSTMVGGGRLATLIGGRWSVGSPATHPSRVRTYIHVNPPSFVRHFNFAENLRHGDENLRHLTVTAEKKFT